MFCQYLLSPIQNFRLLSEDEPHSLKSSGYVSSNVLEETVVYISKQNVARKPLGCSFLWFILDWGGMCLLKLTVEEQLTYNPNVE